MKSNEQIKNEFWRMQAELYLGKLLNGEYGNEEDARQIPDDFFLRLTGTHFMVLSLAVDRLSQKWYTVSLRSFFSVRNTIIPVLEKEFFGFLDGLFTNYFCIIDKSMNIIICINDKDMARGTHALKEKIQERIMQRMEVLKAQGIYVSALVSSICKGLIELQFAYKQIKELREYRKIMDNKETLLDYDALSFDKIPGVAEHRDLENILAYCQAIKNNEYAQAAKCIWNFIEESFFKYPPLPQNIGTLFQATIHLIFLSIGEIQKNTGMNSLVVELLKPEHLLFECSSIAEIRDRVISVLEILENYSEPDTSVPRWFQTMLWYIDLNITDVSLNVTKLADEFSLNPSYLSSAFKKHAGMRLLDYINNQRVQYAKRLVICGASAGEAAEKSGFGSMTTMRRAFLKFEGTLPSQL